MASQGLVIANTTPLINFAEIGRLGLLGDLFGEIAVPKSVVGELQAKRALFPAAAAACQSPLLRVCEAANKAIVTTLTAELHEGEAECITLAMESPSSLLLLDELAARYVAERHGLAFTGTIGCLRLARDTGLIQAIAPVLDELRVKARFWLKQELVDRILRDAGEFP